MAGLYSKGARYKQAYIDLHPAARYPPLVVLNTDASLALYTVALRGRWGLIPSSTDQRSPQVELARVVPR